ncbi:MAG TPA: ATP-binding protein [Ktedonobacteraceae bacterium]|nr:ATP-binding protein [Ktedonobacteraceae bacterium]
MRKQVHSQTEVQEAVIVPAHAPPDIALYTRGLLEPLFEQSASAMVVVDEQFHVADCNTAACTKYGWTCAAAIGQHCSEVLGCKNLNGMFLCGTSSCPLTRVLQENVPIPNEDMLCGTLPGHSAEYAVGVTPVKSEEGRFAVFSARDVSALKVANSVRSNFVSMVSHELRTPLNSVHGFIDLLVQGHMGELTSEQKTYLGYAQEGVQQLISIVEDILLMTRSDSGQFEIKAEEVNFLTLAKQVLRNLQPQASKASVILHKDIPSPSPRLYIDPQRMKQVLNNLVVNAIKFTPPGGTVTLRARPYNERFIMISVVDTGYGIPPEDRQHVFERFYQSNHHLQSRMGGYGLGLPIARLIVEQHGGAIDFESTVNKGTTFYFTTPLYSDEKSRDQGDREGRPGLYF